MIDKKIIFISPYGARLFICGNINTMRQTFQSIKAGADYVKGATLASVIKSITNTEE